MIGVAFMCDTLSSEKIPTCRTGSFFTSLAETGRQARLRIWCLRVCQFDSDREDFGPVAQVDRATAFCKMLKLFNTFVKKRYG